MVTPLAPMDGALRARVDEDGWRAASAEVDGRRSEIGAAAHLASAGPVRLEVRTWAGRRAVVAALGATSDAAAGTARVSVVEDDGTLVPAAGVEVSVFPPERLAAEALRIFPPAPDTTSGPHGVDPFTLPVEAALVMSRALREQDEAVARGAAELAGLTDVPALLESLSASLRADATVTVSVGDRVLVVRRWLQCHLGWVAVSMTPSGVLHVPVDRAGILDTLVRDTVAAWEQALVANGAPG